MIFDFVTLRSFNDSLFIKENNYLEIRVEIANLIRSQNLRSGKLKHQNDLSAAEEFSRIFQFVFPKRSNLEIVLDNRSIFSSKEFSKFLDFIENF